MEREKRKNTCLRPCLMPPCFDLALCLSISRLVRYSSSKVSLDTVSLQAPVTPATEPNTPCAVPGGRGGDSLIICQPWKNNVLELLKSTKLEFTIHRNITSAAQNSIRTGNKRISHNAEQDAQKEKHDDLKSRWHKTETSTSLARDEARRLRS